MNALELDKLLAEERGEDVKIPCDSGKLCFKWKAHSGPCYPGY